MRFDAGHCGGVVMVYVRVAVMRLLTRVVMVGGAY